MLERRAPAGRELREVLVEVGRDRSEDRLVARVLFLPQLGDQLLEVGAGGGDVVELRPECLEALLALPALALGHRVGGADLLHPPLEPPHPPPPTLPPRTPPPPPPRRT